MSRYKTVPLIRARILLCAIACVLVFGVAGCKTKTIFVKSGDPVRIRETVPDAAVWVRDDEGRWIESRMDLPAGWFCLPDEGDSP